MRRCARGKSEFYLVWLCSGTACLMRIIVSEFTIFHVKYSIKRRDFVFAYWRYFRNGFDVWCVCVNCCAQMLCKQWNRFFSAESIMKHERRSLSANTIHCWSDEERSNKSNEIEIHFCFKRKKKLWFGWIRDPVLIPLASVHFILFFSSYKKFHLEDIHTPEWYGHILLLSITRDVW